MNAAKRQPKRTFSSVQRSSQLYSVDGKPYSLLQTIGANEVMLRAVDEPQEVRVVRISNLAIHVDTSSSLIAEPPRDPESYSEREVSLAETRLEAITPVLNAKHGETAAAVQSVSIRLGVSLRTIHRWVRQYREGGSALHLLGRKRGAARGQVRIAPEVEAIIAAKTSELHLSRQRKRPAEVFEKVKEACALTGLPQPSQDTVYRRIREINEADRAKAQGRRRDYEGNYQPKKSKYPETHRPYEVLQIDHTLSQVMLVDEISRKPLGRCWTTLVIDVHTRLIVGWHFDWRGPSYLSALSALTVAILPKAELLQSLGIDDRLPAHGLPSRVHADNAKEFRGNSMKRALTTNGIDISFRPVKKPRYGGHIESLMRTRAMFEDTLPGTTFSNPSAREGYNSEKEAVLTISEFERIAVNWIVNTYNYKLHSSLNQGPIDQWADAIRLAGLPPPVPDVTRFKISMLPWKACTIQQYGIQWDRLRYFSDELIPLIKSKDKDDPKHLRKFVCRRDPRNLLVVYVYIDEEDRYVRAVAPSTHENELRVDDLRTGKKMLKDLGVSAPRQEILLKAAQQHREMIDNAIQATKAAKRVRESANRDRSWIASPTSASLVSTTKPLPPPVETVPDEEIVPFDDVGDL